MEHYDIIIIGSGAGGGTLLHKIKDSGKKILILERGTFLPREKRKLEQCGSVSKRALSYNRDVENGRR